MTGVRALVVLPLDEPIGKNSTSTATLNARTILEALVTGADLEPGLEITAVVPRESDVRCDTITVDPAQIGPSCRRSHEIILTALALSGRLREYEVVHWLAPVPNAVLVHAADGGTSLFTPSDPELAPFLPAIAALGHIETASAAAPEAVSLALHPVSFACPLSATPRTVVCLADPDESVTFNAPCAVAEYADSVAAQNPLAVFGPRGASDFDHLVWATRAFAAGAIYLHDGSMTDHAVYPEGAVVPLARAQEALEAAARDASLPVRLRRWALAHCAPAATAARLRRRYRAVTSKSR